MRQFNHILRGILTQVRNREVITPHVTTVVATGAYEFTIIGAGGINMYPFDKVQEFGVEWKASQDEDWNKSLGSKIINNSYTVTVNVPLDNTT